MISEQQREAILEEAQEAIQNTFQEWIDKRHALTGESRQMLAAIVGKAMFLQGSIFVGNALQLGAKESLREAGGVLKRFAHLARRKHGRK